MGDAELPVPEKEIPKEDPVVVEERRKWRVKAFISLLQDENLHYRWKAAEALGEEGDNSAVEPLIHALKDPYVDVQWLAAKSLGKIGDIRALEPLIASLKAEDKWLRQGAAWGLGKLRDPRAVEPLLACISDTKKVSGKTLPGHWEISETNGPLKDSLHYSMTRMKRSVKPHRRLWHPLTVKNSKTQAEFSTTE